MFFNKAKSFPVFFIILLLINGCTGHSGEVLPVELDIPDSTAIVHLGDTVNPDKIIIQIEAGSDSAVSFYLSPREFNFGDYQKLVTSIVGQEMSDKTKAVKLWRFVCNWVYNCAPAVRKKQMYDPLKMLNSFECGICGAINATLANLNALAGLRSRVYHLGGHVVSEVYYNKDWHMFDADQGIYFMDSTGEVASVNYISRHSDLLLAAKNKLQNFGAWPFVNHLMKHIYGTGGDNMVSAIYTDINYDYNNRIILQSGDKIKFEISKLKGIDRLKSFFSTHSIPEFQRIGTLTRNGNLNFRLNEQGEALISESSPYAIRRIIVNHQKISKGEQTDVEVYYSPDGEAWYFKGIIGKGLSSIAFSPCSGNSENITFSYYLKLKAGHARLSDGFLKEIFISNDLLFSDKIFINKNNSFRLVKTGSGNFPVNLKIWTKKR